MTDVINGKPEAKVKKAPGAGTKPGWNELTLGGVIVEPGNSVDYETGDWRSQRPVFHAERCINCMFCWIYCPDASILVENAKVVGIDYFHCKGCGICSTECPVKGEKAITMEDESKFGEEA